MKASWTPSSCPPDKKKGLKMWMLAACTWLHISDAIVCNPFHYIIQHLQCHVAMYVNNVKSRAKPNSYKI